jgi:hypothetical protein
MISRLSWCFTFYMCCAFLSDFSLRSLLLGAVHMCRRRRGASTWQQQQREKNNHIQIATAAAEIASHISGDYLRPVHFCDRQTAAAGRVGHEKLTVEVSARAFREIA